MNPVTVGNAILWHGDSRDILPTLSRVDAVITDPPYEEQMHRAKRGRKNYGAQRRIRTDGHANPRPVEFASIDGMREWISVESVRLSTGWVLIFCTPEGVAPWRDAIEAAGARYKRACIWIKPDAAPQFNGQGPAMGAEMFISAWCGKGISKWNGGGRRNIFTHLTNASNRDGRHETEKPLSLMRELIELFTNPSDLVLDPFMGSGATGVAALRLGRRFIGIEKERKYFDWARERIDLAASQPDLFLREKAVKPPTLFGAMEKGAKHGKASPP